MALITACIGDFQVELALGLSEVLPLLLRINRQLASVRLDTRMLKFESQFLIWLSNNLMQGKLG